MFDNADLRCCCIIRLSMGTQLSAWKLKLYERFTQCCIINKLAPCGTDGRLFATNVAFKFKVTWHKNEDKMSNIRPDQIEILCPSLRISVQLPAPTVSGGGDSWWKWEDFQLSRARDLDLDLSSGRTAYRRASLTDLRAKFHKNRKKTFVDGWTDVRTDGHLRPTLLSRLIRVDLRSKRKPAYVSLSLAI